MFFQGVSRVFSKVFLGFFSKVFLGFSQVFLMFFFLEFYRGNATCF